jgi:hypothetical protein
MSLPGAFPARFPLHKGVPSLLHSPSTPSPYQCQFLSSKHQPMTLSAPVWIWVFSVPMLTISVLGKLPIFFTKTSHFSLLRSGLVISHVDPSFSFMIPMLHFFLLPLVSLPLPFLIWNISFSPRVPQLASVRSNPRVKLPNRRGTSRYSWLTASA